MNKLWMRAGLLVLLVLTTAFAVMNPKPLYHPVAEIHFEPAQTAMKMRFVIEGQRKASECEALLGKISITILSTCAQCRIVRLQCSARLSDEELTRLSTAPLETASGRMANGVMTFESESAALSSALCQSTALQSRDTINPVTCYERGVPRPLVKGQLNLETWVVAVVLTAWLSAFLLTAMILRYEHLHAHLSHDHVDSGPQKDHDFPTPRIGGIPLMVGLFAGASVMLLSDGVNTERDFGLLILSSLPAFLGGVVEDITKRVGVLERLLLTILAGVFASWLLGATLPRIGLPLLDTALAWMPIAVLLTAFAVGGIANAINIIDGTNGLALGVSATVLAGLGLVAYQVGDALILASALAVLGAVLGLLFWNWPGGKIFLGDGGAYLLGFLLAELAVLIVVRNPEVTPWFPLLLLVYPIFEVLYSVYRRKVQHQLSPGEPDNKHLHQLIRDRLVPRADRTGKIFSRLARNSGTAKYLWAMNMLLVLLAVSLWQSPHALMASAAGFCVFYVLAYRWLIRRPALG